MLSVIGHLVVEFQLIGKMFQVNLEYTGGSRLEEWFACCCDRLAFFGSDDKMCYPIRLDALDIRKTHRVEQPHQAGKRIRFALVRGR